MSAANAVSRPVIATVGSADIERAISVLVLAFSADPVTRWTYPDPDQYLTSFRALVRAFGGRAFEQDTARRVDDYAGVALWLPPGIEPDEAALAATMPAGRESEMAAVFEGMAAYHPSEAHWYLPLIGVDPLYRGKGCGGALLEDAVRLFDRDHVAAYLESTNPANIPLYQRYGFEVLGTVQAGTSPPLFPMLRQAR
ncbi:GNAT family N-acetyltransferase [Bradyrhizobium sp. BRP22]|uniref:GNAT family N-acetyltransferase n=1 Tax=Bradyrhizobium sp. BRP22 TaxID=2793821 RepID=UPI001CD43547|nr:GNAT family N-acetyltransferase [Bradyrhizobium sp. BRP22]MCA1452539.1 GNAT family N-acetyltransferase [Bradyrhizobium sp. BRP22]